MRNRIENVKSIKQAAGNASRSIKQAGKTIKAKVSGFKDIATGAGEKVGRFGSKVLDTGIGGLKKFMNAIMSGDPDKEYTKEQAAKDTEQLRSNLSDIFDEMKLNKGKLGVGAVLGVGTSFLTGAVVGPIAGAAIGAGIGLLTSSNKVQDILFGKKEKETDEEYAETLRSKLHTFFRENAKKTGLGGVIGGLAGTVLGGHPILGMFAGSAIGFASSSKKFQEFMFGDVVLNQDGEIKMDRRKWLGKARDAIIKNAPQMAIGGGIGALIGGPFAGSFGVVGGALIGSVVGLASTTDRFKEFMFGGESKDSKARSITGLIRNKIIKNMDELFHNTNNFLKGLGKRLMFRITRFGKRLFNKIGDRINKLKNSNSLFGKIFRGVTNIVESVVKAPFKIVGKGLDVITKGSKRFNLKNGYDVWNAEERRNMTAAERMEERRSKVWRVGGRQVMLDEDGNPYQDEDGYYYNTFGRRIRGSNTMEAKEKRKYRGSKLSRKFDRQNNLDQIIAETEDEDLYNLRNIFAGVQDPKTARDAMYNELTTKMFDNLEKRNIFLQGDERKEVMKLMKRGKTDEAIEYLKGLNSEFNEAAINGILGYTGEEMSKNKVGAMAKANARRLIESKYGINLDDLDIENYKGLIDTEMKARGISFEDRKMMQKEKKVEDYRSSVIGALVELTHLAEEIAEVQARPATWLKGEFRVLDKIRTMHKLKQQANHQDTGLNADNNDVTDVIDDLGGSPAGGASGLKSTNTTEYSIFGNIQHTKNNQGEDTVVTNDMETDASLARRDKFFDSINALPGISNGINKIGGLFSNLGNKLIGTGEEGENGEGEGILSKIGKFLFGGGLFRILGTVLQGAAATILAALPGIIGAAILSGGADDIAEDTVGQTYMFKGNDTRSNLANTTSYQLNGKDVAMDRHGNPLQDENGNYLDTEGNAIDMSTKEEWSSTGSNNSLAARIWKNTAKNFFLNSKTGGLATFIGRKTFLEWPAKILGKLGYGETKVVSGMKKAADFIKNNSTFTKVIDNIVSKNGAKTASNVIDGTKRFAQGVTNATKDATNATENVINAAERFAQNASKEADAATDVLTFAERISQKAPQWLKNIAEWIKTKLGSLAQGFANFLDNNCVANWVKGLVKSIREKIAKSAVATALKNVLSYLAAPIKVMYAFYRFLEGFADAASSLGIVDTPTTGQRCLVGAAEAILSFLPIDGFVTSKEIMNLLVEHFNLDIDDLQKSRYIATKAAEEAGTTIEGLNDKTGNVSSSKKLSNRIKAAMQKNRTGDKSFGEKINNIVTAWITPSNGEVYGNIRTDENGELVKAPAWTMLGNAGATSDALLRNSGYVVDYKIAGVTSDMDSHFGGGLYSEGGYDKNNVEYFRNLYNNNGVYNYSTREQDLAEYEELKNSGADTNKITTDAMKQLEELYSGEGSGINESRKIIDSYSSIDTVTDLLEGKAVTKDRRYALYVDNPTAYVNTMATLSTNRDKLSGVMVNNMMVANGTGTTTTSTNSSTVTTSSSSSSSSSNSGGNIFTKIFNFVKSLFTGAGSGATQYSGGGSGFISQTDPSISSKPFAGSTFGQKGCGPAVAAMASQSMLNDAISASTPYQNDGGVDAGYFRDYFGSQGLDTNYMTGANAGQQALNSAISGNKTILLGQDSSNTSKANSPFGPNNHYVMLDGVNPDGTLQISDPENSGPVAYSSNILKNVKMGISTSGGMSGILRKFGRRFSGGASDSNESVERQVWAFFTNAGFSEAATAGIMGNIYQESRFDPTLKQSGHGPAAGLFQWENIEAANGRWKAMSDYAKNRGKDWTDLDSQLNYALYEMGCYSKPSYFLYFLNTTRTVDENGVTVPAIGKTLDAFKSMTNVDDACYQFESAFERAGRPLMDVRLKQARAYYKKYTGKQIEYTGTYDSSVSTDSTGDSTTDASSTTQLTTQNLLNVGSIGSEAILKAFGIQTGSETGTTDGTDTTQGDTTNWINAVKASKQAVAAQKPTYGPSYGTVNVNGKDYSYRKDCTGLVSLAAHVGGYLPESQNPSSSEWNSGVSSLKGFTKQSWPGWNNLRQGDILSVYGGGQHHAEIFSHNDGNTHYVWNGGSTTALGTPGATVAASEKYHDYAKYGSIYRPDGEALGIKNADDAAEIKLTTNTSNSEWSKLFKKSKAAGKTNARNVKEYKREVLNYIKKNKNKKGYNLAAHFGLSSSDLSSITKSNTNKSSSSSTNNTSTSRSPSNAAKDPFAAKDSAEQEIAALANKRTVAATTSKPKHKKKASGKGSGLPINTTVFDSVTMPTAHYSSAPTRVEHVSGGASGIDPATLNQLFKAMSRILNNIADNTDPIVNIYKLLNAYFKQSGQGSGIKNTSSAEMTGNNNTIINMPANNSKSNPEIENLFGMLAAIAKG